MRFKKTILTIFVAQFISGVLCLPVFAVYPGTFDYNNDTAYIIEEPDPNNEVLLYINFKDKIKKVIEKSKSLRFPSININRKLLSFVNMSDVYFYSIEEEKVSYSTHVKTGAKIIWGASGGKISYYDSSNSVIMEIDINNREVIKIPFNGILFQTRWDKKSNSFLYQLLDKDPDDDVGHLDAKIMKSVDGEFQEYKGVKTLTMSPDGKYYYEGKIYFEMGNVLYFYKTDGNVLIASFEASISLNNANVMWGSDTVRFLSGGGVFDFKKGKFISYTHNFWPEEGPVPERFNPRRDMAADWNNYVLMWNEETKIFEVEDINTGKIIKTYKKFW